jgi:mRNA interferase RelE/StbE
LDELFSLRLSRQAQRTLERLDVSARERLARTLDRLQRNPFDPALDIRPIKGEPGTLRLRVGDWRVIFEVDLVNRTIQVRLIGSRGDIYKKL